MDSTAETQSPSVLNAIGPDIQVTSNEPIRPEVPVSATSINDTQDIIQDMAKIPRLNKAYKSGLGQDGDDAAWGSNFWVTLVDPQSQTPFFACPATGQVSWDPPIGSFVLPPSEGGEWWELSDESRGGIPYYYQTKTGATVWERPEGFVIPLGIIQNTTLGRRLSQRTRLSKGFEAGFDATRASVSDNSTARRSKQGASEADKPSSSGHVRQTRSNRHPSTNGSVRPQVSRSHSTEPHIQAPHVGRNQIPAPQLTPIPGSDASIPSSSSQKSVPLMPIDAARSSHSPQREKDIQFRTDANASNFDSISRARSKSSSYISHRPQQPQSLNAALEKITTSRSDSGHGSSPRTPTSASSGFTEIDSQYDSERRVSNPQKTSPSHTKLNNKIPPSPRRPVPSTPTHEGRSVSGPTISGKGIGVPIPNHAATLQMSPVKDRLNGQPIPVQPRIPPLPSHASVSSGTRPALPADLAIDIQQFSESEFARQYFSTHRKGFIFKRKVPVTQMMTWQKTPLTSPLLSLNRTLTKMAVKMFKVIQHIMGDRERERPPAIRLHSDNHPSVATMANASTLSLNGSVSSILEEERWLLTEGLTHGELRDEIYCQVMKQLTGNPSTESIFKGWQLLCVVLTTFPPSKNFETYLSSFVHQHTSQHQGRIDVIAKYCLRRLAYISRRGPRGKPPGLAEIEAAADAAFHPSTFGESLDIVIRLQERKYPEQKIPIILPFLADGILALGGLKAEGIFRVPGDGDSVSELKLRIDRGYYTTDGMNDPHVLASLLKLWLRELCDPLVPEEMYNECITNSRDAEACVRIIGRLPTVNRRVILFVISFLQLFLEEKVQSVTKMTPANLALVMAPNLLRCNSESMTVVFTNAQYEQIFVYHLLLHLQCGDIDPDYIPTHGLGAITPTSYPRTSKSRSRRLH